MIMSAINHGTDVPADSRREVLMGYQYALHQRRKKLREERDMIMRSLDYNNTSSGGYWDEYSDSLESSTLQHIRHVKALNLEARDAIFHL
jgi:hypothetical protein